MKFSRVPLLLFLLLSAAPGATCQPEPSAGAPVQQSSPLPRAVLDYLSAQRLGPDTVLARSGSRWALGARRTGGDARYLVVVDASGATARPLARPVALASFEPYPATTWFSYGSTAEDGLWYAFDASSEGVSESRIFQVRGNALHRTFQDRTTCRPAEIRREQGRLFLLAYTEPLSAECEAECSVTIREDTGVEPAWVEVLEWQGGAWRPASAPPPTLGRSIADGYRKAAAFVTGGKASSCLAPKGATRRKLESWATRADRQWTRSR